MPAQAAADIGQPSPALVTQQLDGHAFDLAALKGKVAIVHFWATWCAPCREKCRCSTNFTARIAGRGLP